MENNMEAEKLGMTAPEEDSAPVETAEFRLVVPERLRVRVTRPSSSLHGLEGTALRIVPEIEEETTGAEFFDPTPIYWVRFDREAFPKQGWFEECEVEILPTLEDGKQ